MAKQKTESSLPMQKAIELFRKGQSIQAEEVMVQAEKQFGPQYPQAVESGQTSGCDNQVEGLAAALREFVLQRLPPDQLKLFDVRLQDNDFKIDDHLNRKLSEEELEHLNRVVTHALSEFRHKLRQRR